MTFAVNPAPYLSLIIGIAGLAGIIFTALRYRRDDTTALIGQQDTIVSEMRALNEENRQAAALLRTERNELKTQVEQLTHEIEALRKELQEGRST
jgi:predicted  nucleic acid-binding Zn-ribbon protein